MSKRKGSKAHGKKREREISRRERRAGMYMKRGDPDFKGLSAQLQAQGLVLKDVPGDGNCLFRALAEQLDDHHSNLRQRVVQHIRTNSADYAPFLDEDTSFESYVEELSKDGTFAGNDAIVATSRCCGVNVVIHQLDTPCWEVRAESDTDRTVHIAYLRGEHYCSVQSLCAGLALPQLETVHSATPAAKCGHSRERERLDVQCVLEATGSQDWSLAEQSLRGNSGNIDLAIVEMLQILSLADPSLTSAGDMDVQVLEVHGQLNKAKARPKARPKSPKRGHLSNRERKEAAKSASRQSTNKKSANKQSASKCSASDSVGATEI